MGIDAEIQAVGPITDEEMAAAAAYLAPRLPDYIHEASDGPVLERWTEFDGTPLVEIRTIAHYYSPGYPRGHWPDIYTAIRLMQAAFPGREVRYGGDSSDDHAPVSPESLEALWEFYLLAPAAPTEAPTEAQPPAPTNPRVLEHAPCGWSCTESDGVECGGTIGSARWLLDEEDGRACCDDHIPDGWVRPDKTPQEG